MNWDTLQWLLGIVLFVAFLVVMMRGCGGMMGGCGGGMGRSREWGRRGGHCAGPEEGPGSGAPSDRGRAPAPDRRSGQDQEPEADRYGRP